MQKQAKVYVAGHTGMIGSAITRRLREQGFNNLVLRTHRELDLCSQTGTETFFATENPEYVILAAGVVGGIRANSEAPVDYFINNMSIANNVMTAAHRHGVKKLLYLGSACMYPKNCQQPMTEDMLLTGTLEFTNEGYALAKICGSRLCGYFNRQYGTDFISVIPSNAYGVNDCVDPNRSHVIPALFLKFYQAKQAGQKYVKLWGTGKALREFIYADDMADACIFLLQNYSGSEPINIGTGNEITIMELTREIKKIVGFEGDILCDPSKPDGMERRIVDIKKISELGWKANIPLEAGLQRVYDWLLKVGKWQEENPRE